MSRRDQLSNASIRCQVPAVQLWVRRQATQEQWLKIFSAKSQETYNNILCFLSVIATVYYILYYLTLHASMSFYAMKEYLVVRA